MSATMQSKWCKATTDYTHFAPYPDVIQLDIDISGQSWHTSCNSFAMECYVDGVYTWRTLYVIDSTGKLSYDYAVTDPGNNSRHNYSIKLTYYSGTSGTGSVLGTEDAVNYYNTTSNNYTMKGHMGTFGGINESKYQQSKTYLTPDTDSSNYIWWFINPLLYASNMAMNVRTDYYVKIGTSNEKLPITNANVQKCLRWVETASDTDMRANTIYTLQSGKYRISVDMTYYNGNRDATGQYIPYVYSWTDAHTFTVYEINTKPQLEILEVKSTNVNTGALDVDDAPPYEGKAPYAVRWSPYINVRENPYVLPVAKIVWNFGDPDSGGANQDETNNYNITRVHTYPDYASRTCTIYVTDVLGNTSTGTARFSPSTKQRQFKDPILTPLVGDVPLLCTGVADVAGSPMPEPEWTYTRRGTGTTYTGTVTGDYIEFSLLKSGTYDVVYKVMLESVETTKSFVVTVSPESIITDDSQSMNDFDVVVLDENGDALDWCKQHTSIQYTEYYQDLDVFSFEIPATYEYAKYLQEGNFVVIGYDGKARLMQVTYRGRNGNTITISGESVFPERVAITATRSRANDGYDVQSYKGESLVRYFIRSCLIDPYPDSTHTPSTQPRGADFVVFGADTEKGGNVTYSARYERLRDIINEICKSANIGYSIRARHSGLMKAGVKIVQGTDRTYSFGGDGMVIFSPLRLKNCTIESDQGAMARNVSIGAGDGIGNYRTYRYSGDETSTGFARREMFTDAGDSADDTEITRMSELALKEDKQLSIRIRVLPVCQWQFGTDYNVGDIVTLESPDRGSIDLQIYSAEKCRRATGDELYLYLGYECASAPTLIKRTAKENTYARK